MIEVCPSANNFVASRTLVVAILNDLPEAIFQCSLEVQLEYVLSQLIVLSVSPLRVIPPPFAVVSLGVATEPISMFLSSTVSVVELIVVVFPLTIKSPPT